ncbi:4-hydroxy-tetrahydrodipicolinate synthase [Methanobrevibacter cuticularis]|uniref:4-hydroxy-tetrahydrodipicolinate synthase n=1 Tax=Methanobrevibacter cuticularis TaxID=47311 RepID=A0A166F7E0_9EURY|nr:4-hydroxy-tetrahydrodipicolinate synthase [Methanobrevibacter cuticularis]KZX17392.1 4-hydroxy-tetrahydrodipicolinate synthase [Methanobrevibacter cuticularis]
MSFEGTAVAMVTPFTSNDEIDEQGYRENINFLIKNGVDGLLAAGTTGESATITHEEQKKLIEILVDEVDGRIATIAGAGSNSTKEALDLVQYSENIGADYALVITPYYNKPQAHGLIEHYKTMNNNSDIPIIVYNVPSRTGTDIDVETIGAVAEMDNIIAIKEANPDLNKVSKIQKILLENELDDKFSILSGNDDLTVPMMSLGAKGVISVVANVDPVRMTQMVNNALDSNYEKAMDLHYELYNLMKVLFIESNPVPTKEALKILNRPAGHVRLPLSSLKEKNRNLIEKTLQDLDLV